MPRRRCDQLAKDRWRLRSEVKELRESQEGLHDIARDGQRALRVAQQNAQCLDDTKTELVEIRRSMAEHEDSAAWIHQYGTEIVRMAREDNARRWLAKRSLDIAKWVTAIGIAVAMVFNLIVHHQSIYDTFADIADKAIK